MVKSRATFTYSTTMALAMLLGADAVLADPPEWAPAWGRRAKEGTHVFRGYDGHDWERDYGVYSRGRCNTDDILAVTGAVAGGVIANRTAREDHRTAATVIGAVIGAAVGDAIGDSIDETDRACMGHSLELVPTGKVVTWRNPRTRVVYHVTPRRDVDRNCREFELRRVDGRGSASERLRGCRTRVGGWETAAIVLVADRGRAGNSKVRNKNRDD